MTNRKGQEWTGTEKLFCVCKNQHQKYITAPRGLHFCTKKAALADCRNFSKKNGGGGWIALSSFARTSGVEPDASHPRRFAPRRLLRNRHPPQTKKAALADCRNFSKKNGGGGWIRTIEGMAGRFTVYCI